MKNVKCSQVYQKNPKQRKVFYKTLCLDCDNIVTIEWQKNYFNYLNVESDPVAMINHCPLCGSPHLQQSNINEETYTQLNETWDLLDSQVNTSDDIEDNFWLNYL